MNHVRHRSTNPTELFGIDPEIGLLHIAGHKAEFRLETAVLEPELTKEVSAPLLGS